MNAIRLVPAPVKRWRQLAAISLAFGTISPHLLAEEGYDYAKAQEFWSFRPPVAQPLPDVENADAVRNRIDNFVLAKLEASGLQPNPPAGARTLLRRLSYDLTGLPPDLQSLKNLPYEKQVDALLSAPQFGERWARLWLDVARYGEDQAHIVGNNKSLFYPNAYVYRDWVIDALNRNLPYHEFLRQQLAADLIDPENETMQAALGFMGLGPKYYRRNDLSVMADEWEDRVDTLTRGVLGLTVACARCHDHFYDPIPTSDYYALAGVFASTDMVNSPMADKSEMADGKNAKKPEEAMHLVGEAKAMKNLPVYKRGNVNAPGETVHRGFLTVLGRGERETFTTKNSGRLDLANALISEENPLTARVWVNRVWGQLLGRPLVATTSNFGQLGEKPSHPALLDDLSYRFMHEGNWSLKWLVREIVHSATYRQASDIVATHQEIDPSNALLWRMNRKRLSVEMWRDSLFAAAGTLDKTVGGPSFDASDPDANRRALYVKASRFQLDPMLALFDYPDPNLHSPTRTRTTTPLQKLFVMNHPIVIHQAKALANRLTGTNDQAIRKAYTTLFGRPASPEELELGLAYLQTQSREDYAQALLATNEFAWID